MARHKSPFGAGSGGSRRDPRQTWEQALAAHRAGIKEVILPRRNQKDLEEVPEEVREAIHFHLVDHSIDAIREAIPQGG